MNLKCVLDRLYQDYADEMDTAMRYRGTGDLEYAHFFEGRADGLRQATLLLEILTDKKSGDACQHRRHPLKDDSNNDSISKRPWFVKVFPFIKPREG